MSTAIKVENVSKQYRLGIVGTGTISHDLNRWWHGIRGKEDPYLKIGEANDRTKKGSSEYVWALKDINFEVKQGEVLGIIGRNGAGKSTLLKILSKTTAATTGLIKVNGRIASLLEVGTGFHPELSGRENIFLNGAILGMRKWEIQKKLDEIVDFSGVGRYIDTPVKRYSSGMYVRLAFSVAAHLEPEILIIDEVLAVGDAEFQKKCLGKMKDVSVNHGRTVLFVSHNMAAMQSLCSQCMYMKNGLIVDGPDDTEKIVSNYLQSFETEIVNIPLADRKDREGEGHIKITDLKILDKSGQEITNLISGQEVSFQVKYNNTGKIYDDELLEIAISISRKGEHLVTVMSTKYINSNVKNSPGKESLNFMLEQLPLLAGSYTMNVMIRKSDIIQDWVKDAKMFDVENGDYYKTGLNIPESHKGIYINYKIN